jgi:hypothetical protein
MEIKARIQIWKLRQNLEIKAMIQILKLKQRVKSEN